MLEERKRQTAMFPSNEEGVKIVNAMVKWMNANGVRLDLTLIIDQLKRQHPELGLEGYRPGAIKQAVYKIVISENIPLARARGKGKKK